MEKRTHRHTHRAMHITTTGQHECLMPQATNGKRWHKKLQCIDNMTKFILCGFEPIFGGLRGNVRWPLTDELLQTSQALLDVPNVTVGTLTVT